jgi:hypothetical protein
MFLKKPKSTDGWNSIKEFEHGGINLEDESPTKQ